MILVVWQATILYLNNIAHNIIALLWEKSCKKNCNVVRNNYTMLLQYLIKELKTMMKDTITNKDMILTKFNNIGSIGWNVGLPFLFDYNQKNQEISWKRQWKFIWIRSLERNIEQKKVIFIKEFNFCIKVK